MVADVAVMWSMLLLTGLECGMGKEFYVSCRQGMPFLLQGVSNQNRGDFEVGVQCTGLFVPFFGFGLQQPIPHTCTGSYLNTAEVQ